MTQQEIIDRFGDLTTGFVLDERETLNDFSGFLLGLEDKLLKTLGDTLDQGPLHRLLPADLPLGDRIGLDYLEYIPATDEVGQQLIFVISWQGAWEIYPGVLTLETFSLQFFINHQQPALVIEGIARLDEYEIDVTVNVPSMIVKGELRKKDGQILPSPLGLLEQFEAGPGPNTSDQSSTLELGRLQLLADPRGRNAAFFLQLNRWSIGPIALAAQLELNYNQGAISGSLLATFAFAAGGHNYLVGLSATHPGPGQGWQLEGGLAVDKLKLDDLLGYFAGAFGIHQDADLGFDTKVALTYLYLSVDTATKHYQFTVDFTIDEPVNAEIELTIDLQKTEDGYERTFSGHLVLGSTDNARIFDLVFGLQSSKAGGKKQLIALYQKEGGEKVPLRELLTAVVPGSATEIPDLSFRIMNALLVLLKEPNGIKKYLFSSQMDFGLDLSGLEKLPLIGSALPHGESLKIQFQPIVSPKDDPNAAPEKSPKITDSDLTDIKALLPVGSPPLPATLNGGLGLIATLQIGEFHRTLDFGLGGDDVQKDLGDTSTNQSVAITGVPPAGTAAPAPAPTVPDDQLKWIELSRHFGPLFLARLGLGFANGQIDAVLDGGISVGPLQFALIGLGAHYRLADQQLSFSLEGVGIDIRRGPLEISGAFLRVENEFMGRVTVKMESFGLSAIGAYGEFEGHPSLFLYAYLSIPMGGPVFFVLEGVAFGFGFNRRLIVPPIGEIEQFPLVSVAIGTTSPPATLKSENDDFITGLREEFALLRKYIPAETGQYFLAIGLKFNSFKTLESFALLVVNFGNQFDLGILGITRMSIPNAGKDESVPKVAVVEMAFSVRFVPAEGFLAVDAQLTPNSYILSSLCKLSGGFAFYSWFSGEHGGDFVVTLGGYHPDYKPPTHYPQPQDVPRLAFNWRLNSHLYFKGEAYFALTPAAMMMGGRLEGHFDLDNDIFSVKASFIARADFLMYWKPFHYQDSASVEINCSLIVHVLCNATISLSAGADLEIWGPEFAGTAHVHAKILFININFDISLGASAPQPDLLISWPTFKESFLPEAPETNSLTISVDKGLLATVKEGAGERWIINAKEFALSFDSLAPLSAAAKVYAGNSNGGDWDLNDQDDIDELTAPAALGVASVGIDKEHFTVQPIFRLRRDGVTQPTTVFNEELQLVPKEKKYPAALWGPQPRKSNQVDLSAEATHVATSGYRIVGKKPPKVTVTNAFPVVNLEFEQSGRKLKQENFALPVYVSATRQTAAAEQARRHASLVSLGFDPNTEDRQNDDFADSFIYSPLAVSAL